MIPRAPRPLLPLLLLASLAAACNGGGDDDKDGEDTDVQDTDPGDTDDTEPGDTDDTDPGDTDDTDDSDPGDTDDTDTDTDDTDPGDTGDTDPGDTGDTDGIVPVDTGDTADTGLVDTQSADTGLVDTQSADTADTDGIDTTLADTGLSDTVAADTMDTADTGDSAILDTAPPPFDTIQQIRKGLIPVGATVTLPEVWVLAAQDDAVFVGEGSGGKNSGIRVALPPAAGQAHYRNEVVEVVGVVTEQTSASGSVMGIDATGAGAGLSHVGFSPGPPATPLPLDVLTDPTTAEPYEGVLVSLTDPMVWEELDSESFVLGADGGLVVRDDLFNLPGVYYGDTYDQLVGILHWNNDQHELWPRYSGDTVGLSQLQTGADQLDPGDLVIAEWMVAPSDAALPGVSCASTGTSGQYVEIANLTGAPIDLDGLILFDFATFGESQVKQSVPVPAGGRVVGFVGGDANCYGLASDFPVDLVIGGGVFPFAVYNHTEELDSVALGPGFPSATGASLEVSAAAETPSGNDLSGNLCTGSSPITAGTTDLGTPGLPNDCP